MYLNLFVGVLCWSLFWYELLYVLSSFAMILSFGCLCVSFMFFFCLVFFMLLCASVYLCLVVTCWEMLTSWLSFVVTNCEFVTSHWYPRSGVVLDCIDS